MTWPIVVQGLNSFQQANIEEAAFEVEVSYTLDLASQLTVKVIDPGLQMMARNYFQVRRPVSFVGFPLEIASCAVEQGDGGEPTVTIEARPRAIQLLKRDKFPDAYGATSPSEFAAIAANRVGLQYIGENSPEKLTITSTQYEGNMESAWDVLRRLAGEAQFVVFEADGKLFFASQRWLLGKWGNVYARWPSQDTDTFQLIEVPNFRRSDDDPLDAEFQALFRPENAGQLRPGMTIWMDGVPTFQGPYLITEVSFQLDTGLPVAVSGRTPEQYKPKEDENVPTVSYTDGVQEISGQ